jgi:hypothetical protein
MPKVDASIITSHLVKTPTDLKRRGAILHSKGKVSQDKLAKLARPATGAEKRNKRDANLPVANPRTSKRAEAELESFVKDIEDNLSELIAEGDRERKKKMEELEKLAGPPEEQEREFSSCVVKTGPSSEVAQFAGKALPEKRQDDALKPHPPGWNIQDQPADETKFVAMITERRTDGEAPEGVTPFRDYDRQNPTALKARFGRQMANHMEEVSAQVYGKEIAHDTSGRALPRKPRNRNFPVKEIARKASGKVVQRKSGTRNLPTLAQANEKASAQAAPATKRGKTSRRAPNPKKPPPSYAEYMGVHSASEAFSLKRIDKLPPNPDPVEHREELLALARHVAGQLQSAPADKKLSAIRDICYAMIRELKKPEPDLSESACGWLVARGKELASKQPKTGDFKPLYVRNDQPALKPFTSIDGAEYREAENQQQKESYARFQPNRQAFANALDKRPQLKAALEKRISSEILQPMKTQNLVPDSNPR